jgi:hypothetical protein
LLLLVSLKWLRQNLIIIKGLRDAKQMLAAKLERFYIRTSK